MLAIAGTVPDNDFGLAEGRVSIETDHLYMDGSIIPVNRGTPALLGAAIQTLTVFGQDPVFGFLAGDTGPGHGSRQLYEYLVNTSSFSDIHTLVFHYLQPDTDWHNRVMFTLQDMEKKPILIADAGFMYAAKMSGAAPLYDLFTPDAGELAFLADENAPHPFYTRGFILHTDNPVKDLVARAYAHENAARYLLVKGAKDYVMNREGELSCVDGPSHEAMEAIGGTGDTLTGIVCALISTGMDIPDAAFAAARANRVAGQLASPTPATGIDEIIRHIPRAVETVLHQINQ
ncbi:MAG TPA: NAD(P)H-hydrate dehydratase [Desulfotignum sp.]|nr:NAD(P)H-hydrate dehydratase [Desulfotignum sp.]